MTQPKTPKPPKMSFRKSPAPGYESKAYLRNFGKGLLEYTDGTLTFYLMKGRFKKQKEVAKKIPLAEITQVSLEGKELAVTWNDITQRFVVENNTVARLILGKANESLKTQEKPPVIKQTPDDQVKLTTEPVPTTPESMPIERINETFSVIDSLFDILLSLHGRVDWNQTDRYIKRSIESIKCCTGEESFPATLDLSSLSSSINNHDVEQVKEECFRALEMVFDHFEGGKSTDETQQPPFTSHPRTAVSLYYLLNDIFLGATVGDKNTSDEIDRLSVLLANFSKKEGLQINIDAIINSTNEFTTEHEKRPIIEQARAAFKKQLNI